MVTIKELINSPLLLAVYVPILLISDTIQALVMITGLFVAIGLGVFAKKPGWGWLNNFIMAGSMTLGLFASTSAGTKVVKGGLKGVIPVIVLVSLLTLGARLIGMGSIMLGMVGFVILVMLPIAIITSRILWKKGKIVVVDKEA